MALDAGAGVVLCRLKRLQPGATTATIKRRSKNLIFIFRKKHCVLRAENQ
jgi:hypothetical protein